MTDCTNPDGHKWILVQSDPHSGIAYGYFIECEHGCGELHPDKAEAMLNAAEVLSVEEAREAATNSMCHMHDRCVYENEIQKVQNTIDACQAYADIRDRE